MSIDVPVLRSDGAWVVVSAEFVDVAPHLAHVATFVVHRSLFNVADYAVSAIETGCTASRYGARTKRRAIADARLRLATKTELDVVARYSSLPKECTT